MSILFLKEIFWKGVKQMTNADIIWKLVERLLDEKNKEEKTTKEPNKQEKD